MNWASATCAVRFLAAKRTSALRSRGVYNNQNNQQSSYDDTAAGWGHTAGDALVAHDGKGEVEGRAAFYDLSLDGVFGFQFRPPLAPELADTAIEVGDDRLGREALRGGARGG